MLQKQVYPDLKYRNLKQLSAGSNLTASCCVEPVKKNRVDFCIEWHESDQSKEKFAASNERFKRNGYAAAKAEYGWWNPLRYIVMNQARRFGNLCQKFGWKAWTSPCECAVCEKKRGMKKKENA